MSGNLRNKHPKDVYLDVFSLSQTNHRLGNVLRQTGNTFRRWFLLTRNQIEFAKHREASRANQVREAQTAQQIAQADLQRAEQTRHNLAQEQLQAGAQSEVARANLAREAETIRSNVAKESETAKHNRETERVGVIDASTRAAAAAETARSNREREEISRSQLAEAIRAAIVSEAETQRHNQQAESNQRFSALARATPEGALLAALYGVISDADLDSLGIGSLDQSSLLSRASKLNTERKTGNVIEPKETQVSGAKVKSAKQQRRVRQSIQKGSELNGRVQKQTRRDRSR